MAGQAYCIYYSMRGAANNFYTAEPVLRLLVSHPQNFGFHAGVGSFFIVQENAPNHLFRGARNVVVL